MSKANLMLALNEILQKAGEELNTWFICVKYAPLEEVSVLLTKNANLGSLVS